MMDSRDELSDFQHNKMTLFIGPVVSTITISQWPVSIRHELFLLCSNTEKMGSNPTQGTNICVQLFRVFIVLCVSRVLVID
jgi:hypothetical protein